MFCPLCFLHWLTNCYMPPYFLYIYWILFYVFLVFLSNNSKCLICCELHCLYFAVRNVLFVTVGQKKQPFDSSECLVHEVKFTIKELETLKHAVMLQSAILSVATGGAKAWLCWQVTFAFPSAFVVNLSNLGRALTLLLLISVPVWVSYGIKILTSCDTVLWVICIQEYGSCVWFEKSKVIWLLSSVRRHQRS